MKKLSIICALLMVFGVSLVQAQQFEIAPAGTKDFTNEITIPPGKQISLDVYLTDAPGPQTSGGVWIDFSGSTDFISFVSGGRAFLDGSEGLVGPWTSGAGAFVPGPAGPGTIMIVVANLGGASPDLDGNLIVGRFTLQCTAEGDASINFGLIPAASDTFNPLDNLDISVPTTLIIHQEIECSTDADCDDAIDCTIDSCDSLGACQNIPDCDDAIECTIDSCDSLAGVCQNIPDNYICDDGLFCNGAEACDIGSGGCRPGDGNPCTSPYICFENIDQCVMPTVTLDIGNGSGFRGTTSNSVTVNLENPNDKVGGVQLDICNVGHYLTCTDCETTERTNLYKCILVEGPNSCDRLLVYSTEPYAHIQEGEGPIAILKYTVLEEAPAGECRDLNPEGAVVSDEYNYPVGVESLPGKFCFASEGAAIPTTSEWGMIIFMSIVLGIGVVTLFKRRMV